MKLDIAACERAVAMGQAWVAAVIAQREKALS